MDEIEQIKQRIDIVELISSYLTVKKAGTSYRSLCPFHNEKTPSMMISPERQTFKCFGCNEGGDIFEFVMKMENLSFREALEMLAQRAGVKLERYKPKNSEQEANNSNKKTRLFQINALSAQVFHKILMTHSSAEQARAYLKKRKLTEQTQKDFLIGYAPSSRALKSFLLKRGFTEAEIQEAGSPDRFYKRIMFPITDVMGNVLGFTGRVLEADIQPKYLNTPETVIFHKGRILYNLVRARGEIKMKKETVVVEGQMDVISSYQAGVQNVVATSGTALTEDHLQILYRYTPNISFAFDADSAGLSTAKKAYEMAIVQGFNVKMVEIKDFKDPGEMIEKDPDLWIQTVEKAKPVINWFFDLAFSKKDELTSVDKKEIAKELLPIIKKIPDSIEQAHFVEILAKKLMLPDKIIFEALNRVAGKTEKTSKKPQESEYYKTTMEEVLIGILASKKEILEEILPIVSIDDFDNIWCKTVYSTLLNWYNNSRKTDDLGKFLTSHLKPQEYKKLELILMEVEKDYAEESLPAAKDIASRIKENRREKLKDKFAKEIGQAEEKGDKEKLKELIKEFQDAIK
ncbi:MAG: primase protein [Berkelbacteria bacterium GW2011_GWE1_39_12]|uniref:DNA primase n=1 Tax=Berkelbacteria bacterium GW2011_GWE1_39_12 TaxID=1618337 RepID=A0A0G4B5S7_9BACT|nr:MAG: primase protein [Berkelbacteria bacterium GW2011_GWE1_39_12]